MCPVRHLRHRRLDLYRGARHIRRATGPTSFVDAASCRVRIRKGKTSGGTRSVASATKGLELPKGPSNVRNLAYLALNEIANFFEWSRICRMRYVCNPHVACPLIRISFKAFGDACSRYGFEGTPRFSFQLIGDVDYVHGKNYL